MVIMVLDKSKLNQFLHHRTCLRRTLRTDTKIKGVVPEINELSNLGYQLLCTIVQLIVHDFFYRFIQIHVLFMYFLKHLNQWKRRR